jgi:hypothetical protein
VKDGIRISVRAIFYAPFPTGLGAHSASSAKVTAVYPEAKVAGVDDQLPSSAEVNQRV